MDCLPQTGSALADNRPLCPVWEWAGWRHHRRRLGRGVPRYTLTHSFGKTKQGEERMDRQTGAGGQNVEMSAAPCSSVIHPLLLQVFTLFFSSIPPICHEEPETCNLILSLRPLLGTMRLQSHNSPSCSVFAEAELASHH